MENVMERWPHYRTRELAWEAMKRDRRCLREAVVRYGCPPGWRVAGPDPEATAHGLYGVLLEPDDD